MKRIVVAVALIAAAVGGSVAVTKSVENKSEKIIDLLQNDRTLIVENQVTDTARTQKIKSEWESVEGFMATFLPHSEIDTVEIGIKCLADYDEQGLTDEYLETLNECINTLNHIKESEDLCIKNIF